MSQMLLGQQAGDHTHKDFTIREGWPVVGSSAHVGLEPALRHLLAQPQLLLAVPRYPEKEAGVMEGSARRPAYEISRAGFLLWM